MRIDSILCWRNAEDSSAPGAPPPRRGAEVRPWVTRCALLNMSTRYIGQWSPSGAPVAPRCTTHWFLVPTHCSGSWDPWYPTTGVSHSLAFILVHFLRYWTPSHSTVCGFFLIINNQATTNLGLYLDLHFVCHPGFKLLWNVPFGTFYLFRSNVWLKMFFRYKQRISFSISLQNHILRKTLM